MFKKILEIHDESVYLKRYTLNMLSSNVIISVNYAKIAQAHVSEKKPSEVKCSHRKEV